MNFYRAVRVEFENANVDPVTDLRVVFDVEKSDGQTLNHATILIYNLNATSRAALARPMPLRDDWRYQVIDRPVTVRLFASYDDPRVQIVGHIGKPIHIYTGEVLWAHNNKVGPDWITHLDLYTGLSKAKLPSQVSFATPTLARTVFEAIIRPLGIGIRYTAGAAEVLEGKVVESYSGSGIAYRDADDFLRQRFGLKFTLEEEAQGLVYLPNEARDPGAVRQDGNTFSPANGLLGTPRITMAGVELRAQLRPHISLLQRFFVQSATTSGTLQGGQDYAPEYFVSHMRHIGDNRGEEWYTEIEGFYANLERPLT